MNKRREFWITEKEVFNVAPWLIGRDIDAMKVTEFNPATEVIVSRERLEALVERLKATNSWLRRMGELHWEDPEYAPNFKKCWDANYESLAAFEKGEGT